MDDDALCGHLRAARERLCAAQTSLDESDAGTLQGAIDRIDLVACDLPGWSRYNGGRVAG